MTHALPDTLTMLRRTTTHMVRNPVALAMATLGTPIVLLLLMYNLFGGVMSTFTGELFNSSYIDYLAPGVILITAIYGTGMAALRINTDMLNGIVARFRSMSISRDAVLTGHVGASMIGTLVSIGVILLLSLLMGFRPVAAPAAWLAAIGLTVLYVGALMWMAIAIGTASKTPEAVNSVLFLLYILPFFSSAFLPTTTMTPVVAWIAQNQPFSPVIDTLRSLLTGAGAGDRALVALAWCIGIGLFGYVWARIAYSRSTQQ